MLFDDEAPFLDDPFFAVPRSAVALSTGEVRMPALCRRVSARMLVWLVDFDIVAATVDTAGVVPCRFGRWALVCLTCFHYRQATVGPYDEVGLLLLARSDTGRRNSVGLFAVELALTSELPLVGGVELLGLSKYLAPVSHDLGGDRFAFAVGDATSNIPALEVSGSIGRGVVVRSVPMVNITRVGGELARAVIDPDFSWRIGAARNVKVRCQPADPHLGGHVARLGLDHRRPLLALSTDDLRGRLNLPVPVDGAGRTDRQRAHMSPGGPR